MNGSQITLALCLCAGFAVAGLLVALLFRIKVLDLHFDERQELARGVAFRYGFYTLATCVLLYGFSDLVYHWCDALVGCVLSLFAGITVLAVTAIRRDAYLGLYERPRQIMALFAVIAVVNLAVGIINMLDGSAVVNGVLTFRVVNLLAGITAAVILAAYAFRCFRQQEVEEDEA